MSNDISTFVRFGDAAQHMAGAKAALPKIISMLYSNFPNFDVTLQETNGIAFLLVEGPSVDLLIYAGAYQDFTAYDVSTVGTITELFTSGPANGAKDRKIKPLSWSIEELRKALEVLELKA